MQVRTVEHSGEGALRVHQTFAVHHGGDQFAIADHLIPLNANAAGDRVATNACAQLIFYNVDVPTCDVKDGAVIGGYINIVENELMYPPVTSKMVPL